MTAALLDYAAAATAAVTSPRSACQQHCLTMLQQQLPRYFPMDCQPAALLAFAAAATTVILPHGLLASSIACLCCSSNYRDTSPRSATSSIAYLSCSSNCSVTSPRSAFQQYCLPMLQRENQPQLHTYLRARNQPQQKRQRICPRLTQQHACDFGVRSPGSTTLGTSASMLQDANQQQGEIHAFSAAASSVLKARNVCWVTHSSTNQLCQPHSTYHHLLAPGTIHIGPTIHNMARFGGSRSFCQNEVGGGGEGAGGTYNCIVPNSP